MTNDGQCTVQGIYSRHQALISRSPNPEGEQKRYDAKTYQAQKLTTSNTRLPRLSPAPVPLCWRLMPPHLAIFAPPWKKTPEIHKTLGHPKLIQLSSKKSFPDLKEEPVQISHGIPSFHHSALRSFSDEAIDMAISSILVLIVSILRSSKGRSVSQNAWLHWNWPIRNLLQKSFLLESLFGERGIALYIKTSARRCRMSSSGGDLPETLLRSTLDAGLCKFRVRLFQFCLIQGRKAAAENLWDSENMKIPITSNYSIGKTLKYWSNNLLQSVWDVISLPFFWRTTLKNFPKYPWNIPQTPNQQFEGIPFIWGVWGFMGYAATGMLVFSIFLFSPRPSHHHGYDEVLWTFCCKVSFHPQRPKVTSRGVCSISTNVLKH